MEPEVYRAHFCEHQTGQYQHVLLGLSNEQIRNVNEIYQITT